MKVLFLVVVIAIAYFVIKKRKTDNNTSKGIKSNALELSPEEKESRAQKELLELKKAASKQYGMEAVDAMWSLAFNYGTGSHVPIDLQKSERLHLAVVKEVLYLKATVNEPEDLFLFTILGDSYSYSPEALINFYIDGIRHPVNLDLAKKTAEILIWAGELKAGYMLKEIEELRQLGYQQNAQTKESRHAFMLAQAEAGYAQAMYRLSRWYQSYSFGERSDEEAKAWRLKARQSGSLSALLEKYPLLIGDEKDERERREFADAYEKARTIYMQAKSECLDRIELMTDEISELNNRLGIELGKPVQDVIGLYVKEAGWPEPLSYQIPGFTEEQKDEFDRARIQEKMGKDFNNVASLYMPLADAGNSEAIRRLGNIKRHILYKTWGDNVFTEGESLLKKSAMMGNVLACWQINETTDPSKMAALACKGDFEAIFALAIMIGKGEGGPENQLIKLAMLWYLKKLIGGKERINNGETLLFEMKVGKELKIHLLDGEYEMNRLLRADKMNYAPGTFGLLRTRLSRIGYYSFEKNLAEKAMKAGFGRAETIYENARNEERRWERQVDYVLRGARSGKQFSIDRDPNVRIECAKQSLSDNWKIAENVRNSTGLPSKYMIIFAGKPLNLIDLKK